MLHRKKDFSCRRNDTITGSVISTKEKSFLNILGISCFYHDSAACLVMDGEVVVAAQEERFDRVKNSSSFPSNAIDFCLQKAGITIQDINYIGFYEKPFLKFHRVIVSHLRDFPNSWKNFVSTMPYWLEDRLILPLKIKNDLGFEGEVLFIKHHLSHASSSYLSSGFEDSAIITADGIGEWATLTTGFGRQNEITVLKELCYPHSLGLLYSAITTYLGFSANSGEGKVMALAAFGKPSYLDDFYKIIEVKNDGSFKIDPVYFNFISGDKMYSKKLVDKFGPERVAGGEISERHRDIASSLQLFTEETILKIALSLYEETKMERLCLAGGVFLNCVLNSRILKETQFKEVFIQPGAGDCGGAIGAALYINNCIMKKEKRYVMKNAYLGPEFSNTHIERFLKNNRIDYLEMDNEKLTRFTAQKIADGKICGWFQGRLEFGPRALGSRSILADPRNPKMKDILNKEVKHREEFRPYGVSILFEKLGDYFDISVKSPFMLLVGIPKGEKKDLIPSALHVDGTSRIQTITREENGIFYDLVKEFEAITDIPMIINTSFNDKDEPIVLTPEDAYNCFTKTRMNYLILGNFVIEKK